MEIKLNKTDAGREASGFGHERKDCTVRALSIGYGISYEDAHAQLKAYGRKDGEPINFAMFMFQTKQKFITEAKPPKGQKFIGTFGQFLKANPKGTFILTKNGHAFAVIDGVLQDKGTIGPKTKIRRTWQIK